MEDLVPIGRFAEATRLSLRALRLYDEKGLLPAARVDPDSGYRYYRPDQARRATLIRLLRRAGMPLAEIRAFLADPSAARLAEYEAALVDELATRRRVLRYLRKLLEEEPMFEVRTKRVPELRHVGRTTRTKVAGLESFIVATIDELWKSVEPSGRAFTLYHSPVNEEDDGPGAGHAAREPRRRLRPEQGGHDVRDRTVPVIGSDQVVGNFHSLEGNRRARCCSRP